MDRVAADTTDNKVVHSDDAEGVDAGAEDADHLPRQHKMQINLRSAVNLHHSLVEEHECRHHQILSKKSTTGTIVSRADSTSRIDTHLQHACGIGK